MKSIFIVCVAVLAFVLFASVNGGIVDTAANPAGKQLQKKLSLEDVCPKLMCLIRLLMDGGDISVSSVMTCIISKRGEGNYLRFKIMNGRNTEGDGVVMNAALSWGKWQKDGVDVTTVSNTEFSNTDPAVFKALGRAHSPSGTEGHFELHIQGKKVAVVNFEVPYIGVNEFDIVHTDNGYICSHTGFTAEGSPSVDITCHKI